MIKHFNPKAKFATIRIKVGVSPNGGRRLRYVAHHTYPDGRVTVTVRPRDPHAHAGDLEYGLEEVEDLNGPREDTRS